jgi:tRNA pseudouridine32 synthase / 23S rRNA pseudouridine746 synthase
MRESKGSLFRVVQLCCVFLRMQHFIRFQTEVEHIPLPEKFTFPFYYTPHPLATKAVEELKMYLINQNEWQHNFGLNEEVEGLAIGKMFGVLVVQNDSNELGYLAAFSGKLAASNYFERFVPPVFDTLEKDGFYKQGEEILNTWNKELELLEQELKSGQCNTLLSILDEEHAQNLQNFKLKIQAAKKQRDLLRESGELTTQELKNLDEESKREQQSLKKIKKIYLEERKPLLEKVNQIHEKISDLKKKRSEKSAALQKSIFEQYTFLNQSLESKSLFDIFSETAFGFPPAGAGECAAPKLFQYAFKHHLKPICMAEFWWGKSPLSEIRVHEQFYPACKGKCEPILKHQLKGIDLDENPLLHQNSALNLLILYEDDYLLAIDKPADFLSAPGKELSDSVWHRLKKLYPSADGPLLVHRLDMSTSGILLIAKNIKIYKSLQEQFIKRKVEKVYTAILSGELSQKSGEICLPLALDVLDRPRQKVCFDSGKHAETFYEIITIQNGETRILFYPKSGRTHQLRVHAAHHLGLNAPIKGDDLYGSKGERLFLHATKLTFWHPVLNKKIILECPAPF